MEPALDWDWWQWLQRIRL